MDTSLQIRHAIESEIRKAFRGVTLGQGLSLAQLAAADTVVRNENSTSIAHGQITEDWCQILLAELESDHIALLDAFGFRYYIPALMLSALNCYEPGTMRVISTLSGLYPKKDSWDYDMHRYSLLNPSQKAAIARFLQALPDLIKLEFEDQKIIQRALRNYWGQYLQTTAE
jgi:hypothetical protein